MRRHEDSCLDATQIKWVAVRWLGLGPRRYRSVKVANLSSHTPTSTLVLSRNILYILRIIVSLPFCCLSTYFLPSEPSRIAKWRASSSPLCAFVVRLPSACTLADSHIRRFVRKTATAHSDSDGDCYIAAASIHISQGSKS